MRVTTVRPIRNRNSICKQINRIYEHENPVNRWGLEQMYSAQNFNTITRDEGSRITIRMSCLLVGDHVVEAFIAVRIYVGQRCGQNQESKCLAKNVMHMQVS